MRDASKGNEYGDRKTNTLNVEEKWKTRSGSAGSIDLSRREIKTALGILT